MIFPAVIIVAGLIALVLILRLGNGHGRSGGNLDELAAQLRSVLEPLAAHYFLKARTPKGRLIDSVARFHLGNGARLERIDWLGDLSPKGLRESAGIMVNYLYRLEDIEKNHEAYANQDKIAASSAVKKLLRSEGRRLLDMRLS